MLEPKRKHTSMVVGIAIAVALGLFQGTKMEASSQSDFFALVIAFLIIVGIFGTIGYLIDRFVHKKHKKEYTSFVIQKQFNYDAPVAENNYENTL